MLRRAHELTAENLHELPDACRACVLWEHTGPGRGAGRATGAGDRPPAEQSKATWWHAVQLDSGPPGKALYDRNRLIAYASFAPSQHFAWARSGRGVSDDALLLATLWVEPGHRRSGQGKLLLQAVLREAARRGCRAVEAFGVRGATQGEWACVVPEDFLLAHGFQVIRDHRRYPLLRLDLRQTARWQESVSHALEGVRSALARGERAPAPAPYVRPAQDGFDRRIAFPGERLAASGAARQRGPRPGYRCSTSACDDGGAGASPWSRKSAMALLNAAASRS